MTDTRNALGPGGRCEVCGTNRGGLINDEVHRRTLRSDAVNDVEGKVVVTYCADIPIDRGCGEAAAQEYLDSILCPNCFGTGQADPGHYAPGACSVCGGTGRNPGRCDRCDHYRTEHRNSKSDMSCGVRDCVCEWFLPPGHLSEPTVEQPSTEPHPVQVIAEEGGPEAAGLVGQIMERNAAEVAAISERVQVGLERDLEIWKRRALEAEERLDRVRRNLLTLLD